MSLIHPKHWLSWIALAFFSILSILPNCIRHGLGSKFGKYVYNNNAKRRNITLANLTACFPEKSTETVNTMSLQSLQWLGKSFFDYSLLFFLPNKYIHTHVELQNKHLVDEVIDDSPVLIFLAHSSALEFSVPALGNAFPAFGSYKPMKNPVFDWIIKRTRLRFTDFVVTREEGFRKLVKSCKKNRACVFLPDEDLGAKHSIHAPFFGEQKATLKSAARLAKLCNAKCFTAYCYFDEASKKYITKIEKIENYPIGDPLIDATTLNQYLEKAIMLAPEQYMWKMRLFQTRPEGKDSLY